MKGSRVVILITVYHPDHGSHPLISEDHGSTYGPWTVSRTIGRLVDNKHAWPSSIVKPQRLLRSLVASFVLGLKTPTQVTNHGDLHAMWLFTWCMVASWLDHIEVTNLCQQTMAQSMDSGPCEWVLLRTGSHTIDFKLGFRLSNLICIGHLNYGFLPLNSAIFFTFSRIT